MAKGGLVVDAVIYHEKFLEKTRKQRKRILYRTAAYGRRTVARSMPRKPKKKKVKKGDRDGKPPYRIVGTIYKRTNFAVDEKQGDFVIGVLKNSSNTSGTLIGKESVPQLLNEGGLESLVQPNGKRIKVEYKPQPFMSGSKNEEIITRVFRENVEKIGLT